MPWKNGRGRTGVVIIEPAAAAIDSCDWRISVATVNESGPFSMYRGFDRTLVALDQLSLDLDFGEHGQARALPFVPVRFPGEWPARCTLRREPGRDLNVMTARARARHRLTVHTCGSRPTELVVPSATGIVVVALTGDASVGFGDGQHHRLTAMHTIYVEAATSPRIVTLRRLSAPARVALIEIAGPVEDRE